MTTACAPLEALDDNLFDVHGEGGRRCRRRGRYDGDGKILSLDGSRDTKYKCRMGWTMYSLRGVG